MDLVTLPIWNFILVLFWSPDITFQITQLFQWLAMQTWQKYVVIIAAVQGQKSNVALH